jgi:hypothetical protein
MLGSLITNTSPNEIWPTGTMQEVAPPDAAEKTGPAERDSQANRVEDLTLCCEMLLAEIIRLPHMLRPRIAERVLILAEKNGLDVAPLRSVAPEDSRKASRASGFEMVRKTIGKRSAVEFGPRKGMSTVTFELVAVGTYRVRMPNFWAVYKDGNWHRGPGILRPGAKLTEEEITKKVDDVMKAVRAGTLRVLSERNDHRRE